MDLLKKPRPVRVSFQFLWKATMRVKCTSSNTHCLQGPCKQLHLRLSAPLPLYSVKGTGIIPPAYLSQTLQAGMKLSK